MGTQLNNFKNVDKRLRSELGDTEAKRVFSRAVYLFHIGANDYIYPSLFANSSTFQSNSKDRLSDFVISNLTAVIEVKKSSQELSFCWGLKGENERFCSFFQEVYKIGGRKFGFLNVGAYDCAPASLIVDRTKIGSCFKPITDLINLHNKKFPNVLKRLELELSGFKYALHDYHTSLSKRINNSLKYGKQIKITW